MAYQDRGDEPLGDPPLRTASLLAVSLVLAAIIYSYFEVGGSAPMVRSYAIGVGLVAVTVLAVRAARTFLKGRRKPSC